MKYLEITHLPYLHTGDSPSTFLTNTSPLSIMAAICARLTDGEFIELRMEKLKTTTHLFLGLQVSDVRLKQIKMYLKQSGYLTREINSFSTDAKSQVSYALIRNTRFFTGPGEHFAIEPVYTKDTNALLNIFYEIPSGTGISFIFSRKNQLELLTRSNLDKFKSYSYVDNLLTQDKNHQLFDGYIGVYGTEAGLLAEELAYRFNMQAKNVDTANVDYNSITQTVRRIQLPQTKYLEELQHTFSINEIAVMTDLSNCTDIAGGLPGNPDTLVYETYQETPTVNETENSVTIGTTMDNRSIPLSFRQLKQHTWISGAPGTGKGNMLISLATQLGLQKVPLLLLESAKSEQHYLRRVLPTLQVWRPLPGEMVMNPFAVPKGVTLGEYKSSLMQTLQHCFKLDGVLEEWFQQAMNNCYIKNGWTDNSKSSDSGIICFGIHEFVIEFKRLLNESTYDKRAKSDIKQGGIARLNALFQQSEMVYDSVNGIPCTDMLSGFNLVQLNCIPTVAGKQQFATLLLIQLAAYMRLRFGHVDSNTIRLVIVLDEAHNLLQGVCDSQGNTYSFAEDFVGLLLELRSLGVAFVISNQSTQGIPKLIPDICGTKVFLGGSLASGIKDYAEEMHLNETTFRHLYQCKPGQGIIYHTEMPSARFFQTPDIIDKFGMKTPYPVQNCFVDNKKQLFVETYQECNICPSRGKCSMELKQEAHRIAALLNMHYGNKLETALSSKDDAAVSKACGILMVEISMMLLKETKGHSKKEILQDCALIQFSRLYNRNHHTSVSVQAIIDSCRERIKILQTKKEGGTDYV